MALCFLFILTFTLITLHYQHWTERRSAREEDWLRVMDWKQTECKLSLHTSHSLRSHTHSIYTCTQRSTTSFTLLTDHTQLRNIRLLKVLGIRHKKKKKITLYISDSTLTVFSNKKPSHMLVDGMDGFFFLLDVHQATGRKQQVKSTVWLLFNTKQHLFFF